MLADPRLTPDTEKQLRQALAEAESAHYRLQTQRLSFDKTEKRIAN